MSVTLNQQFYRSALCICRRGETNTVEAIGICFDVTAASWASSRPRCITARIVFELL